MSDSVPYQAGKDIAERWGIGIYEAQVFLIRHDYWSDLKDE
jgi:hypothetical protein